MYSFFEMMATELVDEPSKADVIVSDKAMDCRHDAEVVRSCDFDKILAFMNHNYRLIYRYEAPEA